MFGGTIVNNYITREDGIAHDSLEAECINVDAIPNVVGRRFGAREMAPQGQEVESVRTS
jgi:hypothetical protein